MTDELKDGEEFRTNVSGGPDEVIVHVTGRLTIGSSPALRGQLVALMGDRPPSALTIDLAGVPYMDTSGIATLVEALKIARTKNTELSLQGLADRPRYLLEVTGMLRLFEAEGPRNTSSPTGASSASKGTL